MPDSPTVCTLSYLTWCSYVRMLQGADTGRGAVQASPAVDLTLEEEDSPSAIGKRQKREASAAKPEGRSAAKQRQLAEELDDLEQVGVSVSVSLGLRYLMCTQLMYSRRGCLCFWLALPHTFAKTAHMLNVRSRQCSSSLY